MADSNKEFPIVLEKDGTKRTAHSIIAYNQLKTEGFSEPGSKGRAQSAKAAQKAKPTKAEEAKADEVKADAKADAKPADSSK